MVLRVRDGRTQDALATALGVTAQAVSRWEKGICCPDVELIPSVANYFGVSIDELFGYDNERSKKVDALAERINEMNRRNNGEDVCMDECIALAREALIEFPGNEKLTLALAQALFNAGYVRRGEKHIDGGDGFGVYDTALHRTYPEWKEAIRLLEKLLPALNDGELRMQAVAALSQLYKNTGEHEKALALAANAPDIRSSREFLRLNAFDGKDAVAACGEALIETVRCSAELMIRIVLSDGTLPPRTAARMLTDAEGLFDKVFPDGDLGELNGYLACVDMLRSYYLALAGDIDAAFAALDRSLKNARNARQPAAFTSPAVRFVRPVAHGEGSLTPELPALWPWWDVPKQAEVRSMLESDPRWSDWVNRTREA